MTYVEGFVTAVPKANKEAYKKHAEEAHAMFKDMGITRMVENWEQDVQDGKVTDFRKAVQATPDEDVLFSWFEYPDKATRDAANQKMMQDPRMEEMGASMPFDGKRMIMGGFDSIVDDKASGKTGYVDGIVVPVPNDNKDAYLAMAEKTSAMFRKNGAVRVMEGWGDDVPEGKVTDYQRAVQAKPEENIVYSWIEWPDKATRDSAWEKMMADPEMQPSGDMPFDGQRMFWGGFEPILDK